MYICPRNWAFLAIKRMNRIKIKNFGPIKSGFSENEGWMNIPKVTVFLGNQGSGKSSVAKLISTFKWMEKALVRGDFREKDFTNYNRFRKTYCGYHNLQNYFFDLQKNDVADLEYHGDAYKISYQNGKLDVESLQNTRFPLPQIMYVPAERNFISSIENIKLLKMSSESLMEFLAEFDLAKRQIKESLQLPINQATVEYDALNDLIHVVGADYKIRLSEASSGFQSLVPLYLVSWYLAHTIAEKKQTPMSNDELQRFKRDVEAIWNNDSFTDEQRRVALSVLSAKFNKEAFINIVEEPEQNLFPLAQRHLLNSLLEFGNMNEANQLILTTHSPYIINFLSIAIQGHHLLAQTNPQDETQRAKIQEIIPLKSLIASSEVAIYQFNEQNGTIAPLPMSYGVPSGKNYLNNTLKEGNRLFDQLLELEETFFS
jgi:predicted ATPase